MLELGRGDLPHIRSYFMLTPVGLVTFYVATDRTDADYLVELAEL